MDNQEKVMKIVEISTFVTDDGQIILNENIVKDMGFSIGEKAWFTYLTESGSIENQYKTFIVTPNKIEDMEEIIIEDDTFELQLPVELLNRAGIDKDADLDILCQNKQIVLKEEIIIPEQVYEICEKLGLERRNVEAILRGEA